MRRRGESGVSLWRSEDEKFVHIGVSMAEKYMSFVSMIILEHGVLYGCVLISHYSTLVMSCHLFFLREKSGLAYFFITDA